MSGPHIQFRTPHAAHALAVGGAVILSAAAGLAAGLLVDRWQWSLLAALLVLAIVWVTLEVTSSAVASDVGTWDRSVRVGVGGIAVATAAAVVVAGGTIGLAKSTGLDDRPAAARTTFAVRASTAGGAVPTRDEMEQTARILTGRAQAAQFDAQANVAGEDLIVVEVAGTADDDTIRQLISPGQLRFRKIIQVMADAAAAPPASSPVNPSGPVDIATVRDKVGAAAWAAAQALEAPPELSQDPTYAPFGQLSGIEVAGLDPTMQFRVPAITCAQLAARPANSIAPPEQQAVACEGQQKFLLDVAKVVSQDVADAEAIRDEQNADWTVLLTFTNSGQQKWTALTREAYNNESGACHSSALGDQGSCRVAVVRDNETISSPEIQGVLTGSSQIAGSLNERTAKLLAGQIRSGDLPVTLRLTAGSR